MNKTVLIFGIFLIFCASGAHALEVPKFIRNLGDDITITGFKTIKYRTDSFTGSDAAKERFSWDNYSNTYNNTSLTIQGKFLNIFSIRASLSDNRFDTDSSLMEIRYNYKGTEFVLGDLTANLGGNELISFNKSLKGLIVNSNLGKSKFTAIASQTKAKTKTITINGNNTSGPYPLGSYELVDGSVRVKVDNREMVYLQDFTINSYMGELNFRDGMIVPVTSVITVSFETQATSGPAGMLYGVRGVVPINKNIQMGLTYISQGASSSQSSGPVIEQVQPETQIVETTFQTDFFVSKPPIYTEGPLKVIRDGVEQVINTDYVVQDYTRGWIRFYNPLPIGTSLIFIYQRIAETPDSANRKVLGLDTNINTKLGVFGISYAKSNADGSGNPGGGSALILRGSTRFLKDKNGTDRIGFSFGIRDINPNFASVESTGFQRNEKSYNLGLDFAVNQYLNFNSTYYKSKGASSYGFGTDSSGTAMTSTNLTTSLRFNHPKFPQIGYTRNSTGYSGGSGNLITSNSQLSESLSIASKPGKFTYQADLSRTQNNGPSSNSTIASAYTGSSSSSRFRLSYLPNEKFSLSTNYSLSSVSSSLGDSKPTTLNFTANFSPASNLMFTGNYTISDSGIAYGSSTGTNPATVQYDPITGTYRSDAIGFYAPIVRSTDLTGTTTTTTTGTSTGSSYGYSIGGKNVSKSINATYTPPIKNLILSGGYNNVLYDNDYYGNSKQDGINFGFSYNPFPYLSLNGTVNLQKMNFIREAGKMNSQIGYLSTKIGPFKKFSLSIGIQGMNSNSTDLTNTYTNGTSSDIGSTVQSLQAQLDYQLTDSRKLFANLTSSKLVSGYTNNIKNEATMGASIGLTRILELNLNLSFTNNKDLLNPQYNYTATSLGSDVTARF